MVEPLRGKQVRVLCGPAAVSEEFFHSMYLRKSHAPLSESPGRFVKNDDS